MPTANRVGGEVDALCNRCKLTLAHTILAMVGEKIARVQCNTCGGAHVFRGASAPSSTPKPRAAPAGGGTSRASGSSAAATPKVTISWEQRLAGRELAGARRYSPKDTYALDEVLEHPNFGYGIVSAVRSDKIDVAFKIFEKTLVHGRGGAPAAKPTFSRPVGGRTGPSDKPLAGAEESNGDEAASESEPIGG